MVFKCRFYLVDLRRFVVSEQWSLKAGGLLIQVVSNTGLTVFCTDRNTDTRVDRRTNRLIPVYLWKLSFCGGIIICMTIYHIFLSLRKSKKVVNWNHSWRKKKCWLPFSTFPMEFSILFKKSLHYLKNSFLSADASGLEKPHFLQGLFCKKFTLYKITNF